MRLVSLSAVGAFVTADDRPKTHTTWLVLVAALAVRLVYPLRRRQTNCRAFRCITRVFICSKVVQIANSCNTAPTHGERWAQ